MKVCPECGGTKVIMFSPDDDLCQECGKWFPAVKEEKEVYCHACSETGGAECPIYHIPPACKGTK